MPNLAFTNDELKQIDKDIKRSERIWKKARREAQKQEAITENASIIERMKKLGVWSD